MPEFIFPLHCSHPEHDPILPESRSIIYPMVFEDIPENREFTKKLVLLRISKDHPLCPVCKEPVTIFSDLHDLIYR